MPVMYVHLFYISGCLTLLQCGYGGIHLLLGRRSFLTSTWSCSTPEQLRECGGVLEPLVLLLGDQCRG